MVKTIDLAQHSDIYLDLFVVKQKLQQSLIVNEFFGHELRLEILEHIMCGHQGPIYCHCYKRQPKTKCVQCQKSYLLLRSQNVSTDIMFI